MNRWGNRVSGSLAKQWQSLDPNSELLMPHPELFPYRKILGSLHFSQPPPQGLGVFGSLSLSNYLCALKLAFISGQLWDTDSFNSDNRCCCCFFLGFEKHSLVRRWPGGFRTPWIITTYEHRALPEVSTRRSSLFLAITLWRTHHCDIHFTDGETEAWRDWRVPDCTAGKN